MIIADGGCSGTPLRFVHVCFRHLMIIIFVLRTTVAYGLFHSSFSLLDVFQFLVALSV